MGGGRSLDKMSGVKKLSIKCDVRGMVQYWIQSKQVIVLYWERPLSLSRVSLVVLMATTPSTSLRCDLVDWLESRCSSNQLNVHRTIQQLLCKPKDPLYPICWDTYIGQTCRRLQQQIKEYRQVLSVNQNHFCPPWHSHTTIKILWQEKRPQWHS